MISGCAAGLVASVDDRRDLGYLSMPIVVDKLSSLLQYLDQLDGCRQTRIEFCDTLIGLLQDSDIIGCNTDIDTVLRLVGHDLQYSFIKTVSDRVFARSLDAERIGFRLGSPRMVTRHCGGHQMALVNSRGSVLETQPVEPRTWRSEARSFFKRRPAFGLTEARIGSIRLTRKRP